MANVVNRITREYRISVNDPDYPVAEWIINPDLSAVAGFESRYWIITSDVVSLMSPAERQSVDDAATSAARDVTADAVLRAASYERVFAEILLDEINALRAAVVPALPARTLTQLRNSMRSRLDG